MLIVLITWWQLIVFENGQDDCPVHSHGQLSQIVTQAEDFQIFIAVSQTFSMAHFQ